MNKIGITTGDLLGIGEEVTYKALRKLNLKKEEIIIIGKKLNLPYETIEIEDSDNGTFCYKSLEIASKLALEGKINAIVTSPVSKEVLNKSGYNFLGQTEVLEHFLGNKNKKAEMLFIADDLRILLLSRHMALKDVSNYLTEEIIIEKVIRFNDFLKQYLKIQFPKFTMCSLNPHMGENGLLGREEIDILIPACEKLKKMGINIENPISADALFAKVGKKYISKEKQEFDGIISCYHDQGLCPAKALAFDSIVNTTIGLPVIRTSPSHGCAYDIKGKNIANPDSMISAIKLAFELQGENYV